MILLNYSNSSAWNVQTNSRLWFGPIVVFGVVVTDVIQVEDGQLSPANKAKQFPNVSKWGLIQLVRRVQADVVQTAKMDKIYLKHKHETRFLCWWIYLNGIIDWFYLLLMLKVYLIKVINETQVQYIFIFIELGVHGSHVHQIH